MKIVGSLLAGIVFGVAAVLLHDAVFPFGLILSLIGSATGVWLVGRTLEKRRYKFIAIVGWIGMVFNASAPGVGNELLVQGNTAGNLLVLGGLFVLLISAFVKN